MGFVVTPQVVSVHPEWLDVCKKGELSHNDAAGVRALGRRLGYAIQDVPQSYALSLYSAYSAKKGGNGSSSSAKGKKNRNAQHSEGPPPLASVPNPVTGDADEVVGIHLHRCWSCHAVLLKPLLCSRC